MRETAGRKSRWDDAVAVIQRNDANGHHTIPAAGLYPHQWNWDSAFIALGWARIDPARAWTELGNLVSAQAGDGMLPHIAFDPQATSYQPGPDWWGNRPGGDGRLISGISQPPVAGIALRLLFENAPDEACARALLPGLHRWHQWFLSVRDPLGLGEPTLVHPHETGRDNSVEWDAVLDRVAPARKPFRRVDTTFVDSDQRPTKAHYDKYASLVETFSEFTWNQEKMARESPFRVLDSGFSSVLAAACADLAIVAGRLNETKIHEESLRLAARVGDALNRRRSSEHAVYCVDLNGEHEITRTSAAVALNLVQPSLEPDVTATLTAMVMEGVLSSPYGVCSTAKTDVDFAPQNYWRGPVWHNITWLCAHGLHRHGHEEAAATLTHRLINAVERSGFREYVNSESGQGLGADNFSWTAALYLDC